MKIVRTCSKCGSPVRPDSPMGQCPGCLFEVVIALPGHGSVRQEAGFFGDYELLGTIGRGAMADVFRARQVSLNRLVALKTLKASCSSSPELVSRLRREAEATANLHHPNIVTVYEVGEQDGTPFFSMELVEGRGMDQFIAADGFQADAPSMQGEKRRGPQATIARVLSKIARAVDHAHRHGVLHRDLKPANILIDAQGEPHLTDFGLAKVINSEKCTATEPGTVLGTPAYMSPEQASGQPELVSTASDIYSLGATLYHMLTGRPPFKADRPETMLPLIIHQRPIPPATLNAAVHADLATICMKCLEKTPQDRYGSAEALAQDLERWLKGEPIEARPARAFERVWRWFRREPKLAGLTAGIVALLTATVSLTMVLYHFQKAELLRVTSDKSRSVDFIKDQIENEWKRQDRDEVKIDTRELAILGDWPRVPEGSRHVDKSRKVVFGVYAHRDPTGVAKEYSPLLNRIQTNLPSIDGRPAVVELNVYKSQSYLIRGVHSNELDLVVLGPMAYVRLRRDRPKLRPLVKQQPADELARAIFTTKRGVTSLADLKEKSLVLGDSNSVLGDEVIKAALAEAGLSARDFQQVGNVPTARVIPAVVRGEFDAGAAPLNELLAQIERRRLEVTILKEIRSPWVPWVATEKLQPAIAEIVKSNLLSFTNTCRFEPASPSDYDALEPQIEAARRFDEGDSPGNAQE